MEQEPAAAIAAAAPAVPGWLLLAHVLGVIGYAGGVLAVSRLLVLVARSEPSLRASAAALGRRVYLSLVLPAAVLLFGSGIYLLVADPAGKGYMKQGYFHMKLTLVLILMIVDHLLVLRPLKDLAKGGTAEGKAGLFAAGHAAVALLVSAILMALFVLRG